MCKVSNIQVPFWCHQEIVLRFLCNYGQKCLILRCLRVERRQWAVERSRGDCNSIKICIVTILLWGGGGRDLLRAVLRPAPVHKDFFTTEHIASPYTSCRGKIFLYYFEMRSFVLQPTGKLYLMKENKEAWFNLWFVKGLRRGFLIQRKILALDLR